jgi:hypothetical protein
MNEDEEVKRRGWVFIDPGVPRRGNAGLAADPKCTDPTFSDRTSGTPSRGCL